MGKSAAHKDMVIGEVIQTYPEARDVIEKYFGTGCLTCPGLDQETISFGATMHGVDPEVVIREINELSGRQALQASGDLAAPEDFR